MSQQFFNRIVKVTIGTPTKSGALNIGLVLQSPLRITFDCTKTEYSLANIGTITINNLSQETRNAIRQDRKMIAIVEAGYVDAGGPSLCFHGDIVDVSHNVEKPEIITTITVMDGHSALKKSKISVSYKKGTPVSQVIKDCTKSLGLPLNAAYNYVQLPIQTIGASTAFTGSAATWLDKLCNDNGLQWSVQNGSIKIVNFGKADNLPAMPMSTYLIGSPKRLFKNQSNISLEDFSGYEFKCSLAPKMEPYGKVTIQSNEIPKPITLAVAEAHHEGDNYGEHWMTTAKCRDMK